MASSGIQRGSQRPAREGERGLRRLAHRLLLAVYRRMPKRIRYFGVWLMSPKITLGVAACIRDDEGRVLLAHHTYRHKTAWSLPGGYARANERPALALVREMREELGVLLTVGPVFGAYALPRGRHLTLFYLAAIDRAPTVDGVEIDELRWATLDEATTLAGQAGSPWLEALAQHAALIDAQDGAQRMPSKGAQVSGTAQERHS